MKKCKCVRQQGYLSLCEPCRIKAAKRANNIAFCGHKKFNPFCRDCSDRAFRILSKEDAEYLSSTPKPLKILVKIEIEE